MNRTMRYGLFCLSLILMLCGAMLAHDFARVDDIPYHTVIEEVVLTSGDENGAAEAFEEFTAPEGAKVFCEHEVSLTTGDSFMVDFVLRSNKEGQSFVGVGLYANGNIDAGSLFTAIVEPGENQLSCEVPYYRGEHPTTALLRIYTFDDADFEISDLKVKRLSENRNGHPLVRIAVLCSWILFAVSAAYCVLYVVYTIRGSEHRASRTKNNGWGELLREICLYAVTLAIVTGMLLFLYRKANINYPIVYANGDEMGIYYLTKSIRDNGLTLVTPMVGGITGGDMFDYPYSDKLSFLVVWIISRFVSNPYLITNLFYFLNYYLIAIIAVFVCRRLKLKRMLCMMVGVLYAFSPYIQQRTSHMWLTPYYMIPLACLISIDIIEGKLFDSRVNPSGNRLFWQSVVVSFFCAQTGLYYAFFTCALFCVAIVVRLLLKRRSTILQELYPLAYVLSTVVGVAANMLPNLLYWHINGANTGGELALRSGSDTEYYGMKLVQLLLPRNNHRITLLNNITKNYNATYPLVTENITSSLGFVAAIGFILSILMVLGMRRKYRAVSTLNLGSFLIATIGGIGTVLSVFVNLPMRCYNRMSVVIMFLSLLMVAELLNNVRSGKRSALVGTLSVCIMLVGLFDQTTSYGKPDYSRYENARDFINEIEEELQPNDMVFMLPYDNWPSSSVPGSYGQLIGYVESEDLHWSYGAMQGREEAQWQLLVAECSVPEMVDKLMYEGYDGVYFDMNLYTSKYGEDKAIAEINALTETLCYEPKVSDDGLLYFWCLNK